MWWVKTAGARADLTTCNRLVQVLLYLWESYKMWVFESFDILKHVQNSGTKGVYESVSHNLGEN